VSLSVIKRLALAGIARGVYVPENLVNRYQELLHLKALLRALKINFVIDVGANIGHFASELRGMGYRGFICSFEPIERAFLSLQAEFGCDPLWRGYQVALGNENARRTMHVYPQRTFMSSLLSPRGTPTGLEKEEVSVRRLDGLFEEMLSPVAEPRILLKLDTQGFDLRVFEGAAGCIGEIRGLQSELSVVPSYEGMPSYLEALSAYEHAGFQLLNLSVVSRGPGDELLELNCFMKREEPSTT